MNTLLGTSGALLVDVRLAVTIIVVVVAIVESMTHDDDPPSFTGVSVMRRVQGCNNAAIRELQALVLNRQR